MIISPWTWNVFVKLPDSFKLLAEVESHICLQAVGLNFAMFGTKIVYDSQGNKTQVENTMNKGNIARNKQFLAYLSTK